MNFLSHFYFDRLSPDSNRVLGTMLPDLVKNADRRWSLHPHKNHEKLNSSAVMRSIHNGWERHLEVDRHFHSSDFFILHTQALRQLIIPVLESSPVRPSFLAHIALELLLDSLLITDSGVDVNKLYEHLENVDKPGLRHFLLLNGVEDPAHFMLFLEKFIQSQYLHSYRETDQVVYALSRICQRIWQNPFTEQEKIKLTPLLAAFRESLQKSYLDIYREIESRLG